MKSILLIFSILCFSSVWGHQLSFSNYLKMQEALAGDNFVDAKNSHQEICDKELDHYKEQYRDCSKKFKDIKELRESFKQLSKTFIENGDKLQMSKLNLMVAECPMAKAKWIQKNGKIQNPYYGSDMLECGSKI